MLTETLKQNSNLSALISILLGLGLASMFRTVCTGNDCVINKGPSIKEIQMNTYRIEDRCYRYNPKTTKCE